MALLKCKECGHGVSDKASACPNCGSPIERVGVFEEEQFEEKPQKSKVLSGMRSWPLIARRLSIPMRTKAIRFNIKIIKSAYLIIKFSFLRIITHK